MLATAVILKNASLRGVFLQDDDPSRFLHTVLYLLIAGFALDLIVRWRVWAMARRTNDQRILGNFRAGRIRWRVAIACIALAVATPLWPWPSCLRFYASWWQFRSEAGPYLEGKPVRTSWRRIGLYNVEYMLGGYKGVVFFQVDHDWTSRYGFTYRPNGPPPWQHRVGGHRIRWRWVAPNWYMEAW
jgi:hypothetical protein